MSIIKDNIRELPPPLKIPLSTTGDGSLRLAVPPTIEQLRARTRDKGSNNMVPSLLTLCVLRLGAHLHRISDLERCWTRRSYHSPVMKILVSDLFPHIPSEEFNVAKPEISASFGEAEVEDEFRGTIDPYLWGLVNSLIIPSTLPSEIRRLGLNITDPAVPALQYASVLNTKTLSLLTCLSFDSPEIRLRISDDSLIQLRSLPCLTLLNLASTPITSRGIQRLIVAMKARGDVTFGPWKLRVLDLHGTFVDDNLFDELNTNLSIFPLLFALDVRMTSVCNIQEFFESWFDGTTAPQELLFPTKLRDRMDYISKRIQESDAPSSRNDHAMLFIDHHSSDFQKVSESVMNGEQKVRAAQKLRVSSAEVCVLTGDTTLLGNVIEPADSVDNGAAKATFRPTHLEVPSDDFRQIAKRHKQDQTSGRSVVPISESEDKYILWRLPPPTSALEAFIREIAAPSVAAREGLNPSGPRAKRPRVGEQTYSVKRLKRPTMESIFGHNPSRRL